jgi:hypothetical protein
MRFTTLITAAAIAAAPGLAAAQSGTPDFQWAKALAAGSDVGIHNISGDITVVPSTSGKVEVTARRTRGGDSDIRTVVRETSRGISICVLRRDDECTDHGIDGGDNEHGYRDRSDMDVRVAVPANVNVSAGSVSGDVQVDGAQGVVSASSVSGNVTIEHVRASEVSARSVSGDIEAGIDALTGDGPLSFTSVSGDVTLTLPKALSADLRMSSVSGNLDTDFPITLSGGFMRRHSIDAKIGGGGRDLRVSTVSGDVRLRTAR